MLRLYSVGYRHMHDGTILTGENQSTSRKACPIDKLSATNPIWTELESNKFLRGKCTDDHLRFRLVKHTRKVKLKLNTWTGLGSEPALSGDEVKRPQRTPTSGGRRRRTWNYFFFRSSSTINVPYKGPNFPAFFLHFLGSPCTLLHELKLSVQKCVSVCTAISTVQGLRRYVEWRRLRKKNILFVSADCVCVNREMFNDNKEYIQVIRFSWCFKTDPIPL